LGRLLDGDARLVSVMLANNETGVLQDVAALAETLRGSAAVLHTDAVQAAGKVPVDFRALGVRLMTLSAHKIYGPKGVGALVMDKALELEPLLDGGGHERGLRAGTENVAGIVGFGAAADLARQDLESEASRLAELRAHLEQRLAALPAVTVFGAKAPRLPNTVQLAVAGIDGPALLLRLDAQGLAVSSGSACATGATEPSHVLLAMGVDPQLARGAIRVSMGKETRREHIDTFCVELERLIEQLAAGHGAAAVWG
jgi:cysteine desulfurase